VLLSVLNNNNKNKDSNNNNNTSSSSNMRLNSYYETIINFAITFLAIVPILS